MESQNTTTWEVRPAPPVAGKAGATHPERSGRARATDLLRVRISPLQSGLVVPPVRRAPLVPYIPQARCPDSSAVPGTGLA
jgi:hypothetical protein